ncbi:MAG: bifunctional riboflavin kinase/FAD synthetase [Clostridiales bacterium]|jgi:riboflavin kinase/FMN adenylyltransferase|nr:bifunctional riboflavin kinase/FAD synthetase [Clostridiales bacterium]
MQHITDKNFNIDCKTAAAIGKFDTLHLGHQALISEIANFAAKNGLKTVVFSFNPSPAEFFGGKKCANILTADEKLHILAKMKTVDYFIEYPFDYEFSQISPFGFVKDIMLGKLNCKFIAAGDSYRFGKNRAGTAGLLKEISESLGISAKIIPPLCYNGEEISSSRIRKLIASGKFEDAQKLMGRAYFISGIVEGGKKIGRSLGFPTVNLKIPPAKFVPADGVYLANCTINGTTYPAVSNIGSNPTFNEAEKKCETFIMDFNGNLYGQKITVNFLKFIRGEKKFTSAEELKRQIEDDVKHAKSWYLR